MSGGAQREQGKQRTVAVNKSASGDHIHRVVKNKPELLQLKWVFCFILPLPPATSSVPPLRSPSASQLLGSDSPGPPFATTGCPAPGASFLSSIAGVIIQVAWCLWHFPAGAVWLLQWRQQAQWDLQKTCPFSINLHKYRLRTHGMWSFTQKHQKYLTVKFPLLHNKSYNKSPGPGGSKSCPRYLTKTWSTF